MANLLTPRCLERIMNGEELDRPVVQVLGQKKIQSQQSPDRYRLLLSDGVYTVSSAMLATQLNDLVTSGQIDSNAVVRIDKYVCNTIQGEKKVMVLMNLTVLAPPSANPKFGNPQPFKQSENNASSSNYNAPSSSSYNAPNNNYNAPSSSSYNAPSNNYNAPNNSNNASGTNAHKNNTNNIAPNNHTNNPSTSYNSSNNNSSSHNATNNNNNRGFAGAGFNQAKAQVLNQNQGHLNAPDTPSKIYPISSLTPYQNRWTIKARVVQKSAIKTWNNAKGEGQLFSINFLDHSGEIRATAFKNEVTKFYNMIEVGEVYLVRKAMVKVANKQYCTFNDYELSFTGETEVIPCDDDSEVPKTTFDFVPIKKLGDVPANSFVDVIGVVKEFEDIKVVNRPGGDLKKRDVTLVDQSLVQIRMTLWNKEAESFKGSGHPILAIKGCKVSDWNGKSLTATQNSQLHLDPDLPESHQLRGWFDHEGNSGSFMEFKNGGTSQGGGHADVWKTFEDVKAQNLASDKMEYFINKATISTIKKENCLYMACPECNKKIIDNGNGTYRCEKCSKEFNHFTWRLILQMSLSDSTENIWVTCFQDQAEAILGRKASEVGQMKEMAPEQFDQVFNEANFSSFIFKLRSKMETYNDESRLKTVISEVKPIDYADYSAKIMAEIEKQLGQF